MGRELIGKPKDVRLWHWKIVLLFKHSIVVWKQSTIL